MPITVMHGDIGAALKAAEVSGKGRARRLNLAAGLSIHDRMIRARAARTAQATEKRRAQAEEIQMSLSAARHAEDVRRIKAKEQRDITAGRETERHHRAIEKIRGATLALKERGAAFAESQAEANLDIKDRALLMREGELEHKKFMALNPGVPDYIKGKDYRAAKDKRDFLFKTIKADEGIIKSLRVKIRDSYGEPTGQFGSSDPTKEREAKKRLAKNYLDLDAILEAMEKLKDAKPKGKKRKPRDGDIRRNIKTGKEQVFRKGKWEKRK